MSSQYGYDPTKVAGSGEVIHGTAGAAIANRDICCVAADGLYYPADADLAAWMPAFGIAMSAMASGQSGEFLVKGFIGLSTWTWTPGDELYVSATAGQMSHTAGGIRQQVGVAFTATQVFIHPQGIDSETGCALLEGHTAYVGFDNCKAAAYSNYWVCDGVADDVQVAAAIAYVVALGTRGSVFVETGVYHMTAQVTVTEQVSIFGSGDSTRFEKDFNLTQVFVLTSATLEGQILRDFMIDGNKASQTGTGIQINGVSRNIIIQNLRIIQCEEYGIEVVNSWGATIKDCTIEYCGRGINKSGTGNALLIENCVLRYSDDHGAFLNGGNDHKIINCIIEKSQNQFGTGVRVDTGDYIRILNNSFEDFFTDGRCVFLNGSVATVNEARIAYNVMSEDNICIEVDDATNTRIYQNSLFGVGTGIDITANATLTHIFDNDNNATTRLVDLGTDTHIPEIFIPVNEPDGSIGTHPALTLTDAADTTASSQVLIPLDYNQLIDADVLIVAGGTGNMRRSTATNFGKICASETYNAHTDAVAAGQVAVTINDIECIDISGAFTLIAGGDLVGIEFTRVGTHEDDTVDADCYFLGFRLRYI